MLCDFDGTLAPNLDLPQMRKHVIELTEQAGVPSQVFQDRYIVEIIDAGFAWLQEHHPHNAESYYQTAHDLITQIEIDAAKHTQPFPGVPELLAQWRARGIKIGVVTRNCRAAVLSVYPDLLGAVDCLVARDDAEFLKPDPRHLTQCLAALQVGPQDSAIIGDGALDMHVGKAAQVRRIGVLSGSNDLPAMLSAGAELVLEQVTDLLISVR